jgi:hypothetical protein
MPPETDESRRHAEELRLHRHAILSTALPFPDLDWSRAETEAANLKRIRDYCESLANGILDWYLENQASKKWWAQWLHRLMYLLVAIGGLLPLLKVGFDKVIPGALGEFLVSHAGELAIFFLGFAGAIKLLDSNGAYTADWMRFITTAARISQELIKFQFEWDKIDLAQRLQAERLAAAKSDPPSDEPEDEPKPCTCGAKANLEVCPHCGYYHHIKRLAAVEQKLKLAADFCSNILNIVGGEISVWADELKKRVDRIASHGVTEK